MSKKQQPLTFNELFQQGKLNKLARLLDPDGKQPRLLSYLQAAKKSSNGGSNFRAFVAECLYREAIADQREQGDKSERSRKYREWKPQLIKQVLNDYLIGRQRTEIDEPELWAEVLAMPFSVTKDTELVALLALRHKLTQSQLIAACECWCGKHKARTVKSFLKKYDAVAKQIADGGTLYKIAGRTCDPYSDAPEHSISVNEAVRGCDGDAGEMIDFMADNRRVEMSGHGRSVDRSDEEIVSEIVRLNGEGNDAHEINIVLNLNWSYRRIDQVLKDARIEQREQQLRGAA